MIAPPRTAEAVLESLGTDAKFRDALLGDLAEEFTLRAERDGVGPARRWYYGETIRTAPHLLGEWLRGARMRDVRYVVGVAATSYVFVLMLVGFAASAALSVGMTVGVSLDPQGISWDHPVWLALDLLVGIAATPLGGYIAAWLGQRAPLASALALGGLWSVMLLSITAVVGVGSLWVRLATSVVILLGTATGGVLRVRGEPRVVRPTDHRA